MNKGPVISVVVPVFNEEPVIMESYRRLTAVMAGLGEPYEIIFVNDGSWDASAEIIGGLTERDAGVALINFSRNFGHQSAITAGMDYARGRAVVVIDADLQDPPEVIPAMINAWRAGSDVVYGKRISRQGETFFKRFSAAVFYRLLKKMTGFDIPVDAGDFRLIDRKVCNAMKSLGEKNRYIRGLISWVGFKQSAVEYARDKRFAGETKYPLKKMMQLAMDGIAAFSYKPLRFATTLGFIISLLSFAYIVVVIYQRLFTDTTITGWSSLIGVVLLTQGIVLMTLGLIGEYIGRIFDETKNRPVYIVSEIIGGGARDSHME
ncbi:MAG: glycosyltransferase family 2 protein [Clostridiales bacterium]|jgi:dolichol-phosphate mannosyltransferase|nr:glycosyltransferase family 2 protein [Clostridiales bacterium]